MRSWEVELSQTLGRLASALAPEQPRIAVVGVGQLLRGDDGAGLVVAQRLRDRLPAQGRVQVFEGGAAPEGQTGALRRFRPALVVLVDAAMLETEAGSVRWLPWQATAGLSASTHTLPLAMLAQFLTASIGCEVGLIGIQPGDTTIGAPLSPSVAQAVEGVAGKLAEALLHLAAGQCRAVPG